MAGPFHLNPNQSQGGIPTSPSGKQTTVRITYLPPPPGVGGVLGHLKMQAGLSAPESTTIQPGGTIELARDFGGIPLTVTNDGPVALTVETY